MLKKIIIAEGSHAPRGEEMHQATRDHAQETELIDMTGDQLEIGIDHFSAEIQRLLSEGQPTMVIMDHRAAVKGRALEILRATEEEHGIGTRRLLVSCHSKHQINKGFRERGVSRKGVRHVVYDMDSRYLDELDTLIRSTISSLSKLPS